MAVPGMSHANVFCPVPIEVVEAEMDPALLEEILKAVEEQTDYAYGCLCGLYAAGDLEIEKLGDGSYSVEIRGGGGLTVILIDTQL